MNESGFRTKRAPFLTLSLHFPLSFFQFPSFISFFFSSFLLPQHADQAGFSRPSRYSSRSLIASTCRELEFSISRAGIIFCIQHVNVRHFIPPRGARRHGCGISWHPRPTEPAPKLQFFMQLFFAHICQALLPPTRSCYNAREPGMPRCHLST